MLKRLRYDIQAIRQRDPAARSSAEVFLLYAGLHALIWYRAAHFFYFFPWLRAAVRVFSISTARVTGPTPPGTGVMYEAFWATAP